MRARVFAELDEAGLQATHLTLEKGLLLVRDG